MTSFQVWAPSAENVELQLEPSGDRRSMHKDRHGWYRAEVPEAAPGTRYRYVVDGGAPMPDPRSAYQPEGVHGPSEVVDHSAFQWSDDQWHGAPLAAAVVYEMHIGTFTEQGTFASAIERLDHLVELGVTAVEFLPVVEFPGDHGWGYDGVDLFAPHHAYGGPDGLKQLVDACHARGLAVIIDVVYNHLGPDGNYLGAFGPYFTDKYNTPWGQAVNYDDAGSDEVRRFVVDNALMWLRDYHADGLRLDAVHAIYDFSATHLLEEIAGAVEALTATGGRSHFLIAESDLNDPRIVARREVGGYGMDAQWSDDFHHALHSALSGETSGYYADFGGLEVVKDAIENVFVARGDFSEFRNRRHGRVANDIPNWRFLGYLQNHDQIGNRAKGERSAALMSHGRLKAGAALVLLSPFVPMLFQGEEWGASTPFQYFTDHQDADLGEAVSRGRKREFSAFGWDPASIPDPQAVSTFVDSKLNWDELKHPAHTDILEWHRRLIAIRRSVPDASPGNPDVEVDASTENGTLAMWRSSVGVLVNISSEVRQIAADGARVLLASSEATTVRDEIISLPPDSVAVVRKG